MYRDPFTGPTTSRRQSGESHGFLIFYQRDLYNAATSWTLVKPAVIYILINNCKFVFLFIYFVLI